MIAVGTTVVRALETVAQPGGTIVPGEGFTHVVVTPERGVRAVDGLLTGWHEPDAPHLAMLRAVGGAGLVERSYAAALEPAATCGTSSATCTCCSRSRAEPRRGTAVRVARWTIRPSPIPTSTA